MAFAGGDGSSGNPYQIETGIQLYDLRSYSGSSNFDKYFILNNDIDLTSLFAPGSPYADWPRYWNPIPDFYGHLDGNNFAINNLKINRPNEDRVGLFATLNAVPANTDPQVKDLEVLVDADGIIGRNYVGIIAGESIANGLIELRNITINGLVGVDDSGGNIGGAIGWAQSPATYRTKVTGISGTVGLTFEGGASAEVRYWGGVIGYGENVEITNGKMTTITHFSGGTVYCKYVGGLAGFLDRDSYIYRSYAIVQIYGCYGGAGGLLGTGSLGGTYPVIEQSFAEGTISTQTSSEGLATAAKTIDCYSRVALSLVSGLPGKYGTGIAAGLEDPVRTYAAAYMYSFTGGEFGLTSYVSAGTGSTCYWDSDIGPAADALSASNALTTAQAKTGASYLTWNINGVGSVWAIDPLINDGYPYLDTNPPPGSIHTVQYAATGGTIIGDDVQKIPEGGNALKVRSLGFAGRVFDDWDDGILTEPRQDVNITASFTKTALYVANHTLTYTAGANGSISGISPQTVADGADGSSVLAVADPGYAFDQWSDSSTDNPRTDLNVTGDITVEASFIQLFSLVYSGGPNGSITGDASQIVESGSDGTAVTAVADPGYQFMQWDDGVMTAIRQDLNVTSSKSPTAICLELFSVDYSVNDSNMGIVLGDKHQVVIDGGSGTEVTAVAKDYYQFVKWSDDSVIPTRTEAMVAEDLAFIAEFKAVDAIYVKKEATGDATGLNWDNACTTLEAGIDLALLYGVSDVRVARGTYYPWGTNTLPVGVRFKNFRLHNELSIIGGYRASSGLDTERDFDLYTSTLSGEFTNYNVYHVLYFDASYGLGTSAVLDGFDITGGKADGLQGVPKHSFGGGILTEPTNAPIIRNCRVHDNYARSGGGIAALLLNPICPPSNEVESPIETYLPRFKDTSIYDNEADYSGGGMFMQGLDLIATPFDGVEIYDNTARYGAGIAVNKCGGSLVVGPNIQSASGPALYVHSNKATRGGGGVYLLDSLDNMVLSSIMIAKNISKKFGGGIMVSGGAFLLNSAVLIENGSRIGGAAFFESCNYKCLNNVYLNNKASTQGGAIYTIPYEGIIDRSTFENNSVAGLRDKKKGGAIYSKNGSLNVFNTFFYNNSSDHLGGAMYIDHTAVYGAGLTALNNSANDGGFYYGIRSRLRLNATILKTDGNVRDNQISGDKYGCEIEDICRDSEASYKFISGNDITADPLLTLTDYPLPWNPEYVMTRLGINMASPCSGQAQLTQFTIYSYAEQSDVSFDDDIFDTARSSAATIGAVEIT